MYIYNEAVNACPVAQHMIDGAKRMGSPTIILAYKSVTVQYCLEYVGSTFCTACAICVRSTPYSLMYIGTEQEEKKRKNNFIFRMHPMHFTTFFLIPVKRLNAFGSCRSLHTDRNHQARCGKRDSHPLSVADKHSSAFRTNRKTGSSSCPRILSLMDYFRLFVRVPGILVPGILEPGFFAVDSDHTTPFLLSDQVQEIFCCPFECKALDTETLGLLSYHH